MNYIKVSHKRNLISVLKFEEKVFVIGNDPTCDIYLQDENILPMQASLVKEKDCVRIYNLAATKDMLVNGKPFTSKILTKKDMIFIKDFTIHFSDKAERMFSEEVVQIKREVHRILIEKFQDKKINIEDFEEKQLRDVCEKLLDEIIYESDKFQDLDVVQFKKEILDEILALGPLEVLLADETVTEIMVNAKNKVFIERAGKLHLTNLAFSSDDQVVNIIRRIIDPIGRRIDESVPMVDARLKDGSRVNAIIAPLALKGPSLTIRKFAKNRFTYEDLIRFGSVTKEILEFLKICVALRKNIIISGGTGTGKTTFLNVVSSTIPESERVVTIEDTAELKLPHENLVSLEGRPSNIEGKGEVNIRDLVKNALRMRPDRIVVGECRGGEAIDMLQAMNTGHDGSLTTVHANSPSDALLRLETMVMMSGLELPSLTIKSQIASAIDIIVQISRFSDGTRKIINVSEIAGIEDGKIEIHDVFIFKRTGINAQGKVLGEFKPTGFIPKFVQEIESYGLHLSRDVFSM